VAAGVRVVAILDRAPGTLFGSLLAGRHAATERRWFNQVGDRSKRYAAFALWAAIMSTNRSNR
jgi:hypothetical protein